jgi:hypothetical protein
MGHRQDDMRASVFQITRALCVGPYPDDERVAYLKKIGVTHLLNLCSSQASPLVVHAGFKEVLCYSIADLTRIPDRHVIDCLDAAHRMLREPDSRLYIHCLAGQNRSPNILWLYLIACGMDAAHAKRIIEERSLDAVPGHERMVDERLVTTAKNHGRANFLPLKRAEIIELT